MVTQKREPELSEQERRQRQIELNREAIALLDSWRDDDSESVEEQRKALDALMRGIDEHRDEERKLFSAILNDPNYRSR
jgi:hypothetical protein